MTVRCKRNDDGHEVSQNTNMARKKATPPEELNHQWFLSEWATHFKLKQADAQRALGWAKANASYLWNGKQLYNQENIDQVSTWLGIRPYELLMPPKEALAIRALRESAKTIVASIGDKPDGAR